MKIYTRTGDTGETALFDNRRVSKADPRVDAYGEVDELNAWLGLVRAGVVDPDIAEALVRIQRDLFAVGAQLADPSDRLADRVTKAFITDADVARLEALIDHHRAGIAAADAVHSCRRRFGRCVAARRAHGLPPGRAPHRRTGPPPDLLIVRYINRLSDLLFVLARVANHRASHPETAW